ncbi:unnamed protein product [Cochlearia groenlandica]
MIMYIYIYTRVRMQRRRQRRVFDSKGNKSYGIGGSVNETICGDESPCCFLLILYARMGLHRYNLLHGGNYQFLCVKKYNLRRIFASSTYYITFDAMELATSLLQTFQTIVDSAHSYGWVHLECTVTRPRAETKIIPGTRYYMERHWLSWPKDNPFLRFDDLVKKKKDSSDGDYDDWIRLYLDIATTTRRDADVSNWVIMKVAIDNRPSVRGGLNANVYIRYKEDSCSISKERIAKVSRVFDEKTGYFCLVAQHKSSEELATMWRHRFFRRRLGILNPWRLSSPRSYKNRHHKARSSPRWYKNRHHKARSSPRRLDSSILKPCRGFGLSRFLHKTRE